MPYHLLTGATGLLGSYLLRDHLLAGRQIAVVVRSGIVETARQRIESILARWEQELGCVLPRPPVLEGDICQPDLGFDQVTLEWVANHCISVLHNAASLSFQADEKSGEPFRSNIEGTRNVLELCRKTGIRQFHHVSTAYVCGLRTGRVLETELDVGQQSGNAYEQSKIEGEQMVRDADFLDSPTVYRPAIIIGDSMTGYTTTFHGFYTPLKIGQALIDQFHLTEIVAAPLTAAIGLCGEERKNLVPVDWVSQVITHIYGRPEHHGRTYHLTPRRPVTVATLSDVTENALKTYAGDSRRSAVERETPELKELQDAFTKQMEVYRVYWRDDPDFDRRNLEQAAPHLPCPETDADLLLRTSLFALNANFGWPRPSPIRPEFDVSEHLAGILPVVCQSDRSAGSLRIGLVVNGPGGGQWTLLLDAGRPVTAETGLAGNAVALLRLDSKTYRQCVCGELTVQQAAQLGRLTAEGDHLTHDQLFGVLRAAMGRNGP